MNHKLDILIENAIKKNKWCTEPYLPL
jgi:hypothetical protein